MEFMGLELKPSEILEVEYVVGDDYTVSDFRKGNVYLYTRIDEELKREAYAREIVRRIQEMRKELDLEVDEFIKTWVGIDPKLVDGWVDYIKEETRSKELIFGEVKGYIREWNIEGSKVKIGIEKHES